VHESRRPANARLIPVDAAYFTAEKAIDCADWPQQSISTTAIFVASLALNHKKGSKRTARQLLAK
jgi:hypothetical protein